MGFKFTNPIALVLLILVPYFYMLYKVSLANLAPLRAKTSLGIRLAILLLLIFSLSGLQIVKHSNNLSVIFVLDFSDSVNKADKQYALNYIKQAINTSPATDTVGIVVFGADAWVELPPTLKPKVSRIYSVVSSRYTDISEAIRLAVASFPANVQKRIVVLSDGNENKGVALEEAKIAYTNDVQIDVVPLPCSYDEEVLLEHVLMPSELKVSEAFEVKIVANSRKKASGKLKLFRNGYYIGEQPVDLIPGKNVFLFSQSLKDPGFYTYEASLKCEEDTLRENNRAMGFCLVKGKPKILYIEGEEGQAHYLANVLSSKGIAVEKRFIYNIPTNLAELQSYDTIILSDLSAEYLSPAQLKLIASNVRDLGIGLVMIGGANSFGVGGYYGTPIEEALPVSMDIRKKKELPSLALMLVIDKSSSMGEGEGEGGLGYQKVDLAKEAAVATVEILDDRDFIGVVCFDFAAKLMVPLQAARNKQGIESNIASIVAGGGTDMYPAMEAAYETLKKAKARLKHTIVLTDGMTHPGDFQGLTLAMVKAGITVSSVAVGTDADVNLLQKITNWGNGNFYYTDDPHNIPRIFTKEAMIASRAAIVEEPFIPKVDPTNEILKGIDWQNLPPLLGYVATTPKPLADITMVSHKGDPVLASWRYGLGKSVAFTSDAKNRWAAHWIAWSGYGKFWPQAIRWTLRKSGKANFQTSVELKHNKAHIVVDAFDEQGNFINFMDVNANVVTPAMQSLALGLEQTAPGRYEGEFDANEIGAYLIGLSEKSSAGTLLTQTTGLVIPYSPEYKSLETNNFLFSQLTELTDGKVLRSPKEAFWHDRKTTKHPTDIWYFLVLMSILLFPVDVAIRRVIIGYKELVLVKSKIVELWQKLRPAREVIEQPTAIGPLIKKVKRKIEEEIIKPALKEEKPEPTLKEPEEPKPAAKPQESFTSKLLKAKKRALKKK